MDTKLDPDNLHDPTCSRCKFSRRAETADGDLVLECRFTHLYATGERNAQVLEDDHCADGAWSPRELGLPVEQVAQVGYLVARVEVDERRRQADKSIIVASRELLTPSTH